MELPYLMDRLKILSGLKNIDSYEEDLKKLVECHNRGEFSIHSRMKVISKQINLGLDNIYGRTIELLKYSKDSSSLEASKLRYGDEEGKRRYEQKNNNCKQTLEKFITKYGEIDGKIKYEEYNKSKSMSLEMCIKRHGEIEGPIVFREFWDFTGFGTSKRAFKKRYGDDWEKHYIDFSKKQGENNTLNAKILKYGEEEGLKKFKELNDKKSKSLNKETLIKKMLNEGASYDEIRIEILNRWDNNSIHSFIARYGEKDGRIKYEEFIKRHKEANPMCIEYYEKRNIPEDISFEIISKIHWERNKKISKFSKESLFYFNKLNEILKKRGKKCLYREDEIGIFLTLNEHKIYNKNRYFFYDFYIPKSNLIIEYHGAKFHSDIDYNSTLMATKENINNFEYNRDFFKKWIAEQRGYNVLILRSWKITEDLEKMFSLMEFTEYEKCKFL